MPTAATVPVSYANRCKTHNKEVLEKFKRGELQVLVNVQMLTTGTDIPDIDSVFLTRQTTSQILLTQMVGRALRGPKAGGTEKAYIVCFIDNWQQVIDWPTFEWGGGQEDPQKPTKPAREIEYISIDLLRKLAQIESAVTPGPFLSLMPVGWYLTEIEMIDQNEDSEIVQRLAMVFEHEKAAYDASINHFRRMESDKLAQLVEVDYEESPDSHSIWVVMQQFFPHTEGTQNRLLTNLYLIAKHIHQNQENPEWFDFESRSDHDLDAIARKAIVEEVSLGGIDQWLMPEYERDDRFWRAFYKSFSHFRVYFDACVRRESQPKQPPSTLRRRSLDYRRASLWLAASAILQQIGELLLPQSTSYTVDPLPPVELDDETKAAVKKRDHFQCQCCGDSRERELEVDHIKAQFHGGTHDLANLQLLCKVCNHEKNTQEINFRVHKSPLLKPEDRFPDEMLKVQDVYSMTQWEMCLRRSINFFYQAAVVKQIRRVDDLIDGAEVGKRWEVYLYPGNNPKWISPHLIRITRKIRKQTLAARIQQPTRIAVGDETMMVVTGD